MNADFRQTKTVENFAGLIRYQRDRDVRGHFAEIDLGKCNNVVQYINDNIGMLLKETAKKVEGVTLKKGESTDKGFKILITYTDDFGQHCQEIADVITKLAPEKTAEGKDRFKLSFGMLSHIFGLYEDMTFLIKNAVGIANRALDEKQIRVKCTDFAELFFSCSVNIDYVLVTLTDISTKYVMEARAESKPKSIVLLPRNEVRGIVGNHGINWIAKSGMAKKKEKNEIVGKTYIELVNEKLAQHKLQVCINASFEDDIALTISTADEKPAAASPAQIEQPELKKSWGDLPTTAFPALPGAKAVTKKPIKAILTKPTQVAPMAKPVEVAPTVTESKAKSDFGDMLIKLSASTQLTQEQKATILKNML